MDHDVLKGFNTTLADADRIGQEPVQSRNAMLIAQNKVV